MESGYLYLPAEYWTAIPRYWIGEHWKQAYTRLINNKRHMRMQQKIPVEIL